MNSRTAFWLRYLPNFLRSRIEGRPNLQKVLNNTGWLFADKVLRMGVGLIVGVWIARYLGPRQFGLWNFAIAFTSLFGAVATLGLDNIVVRELVKHPDRKNEFLGSAFVLKLFGSIITSIVAIVAISLLRDGETLTLWLVALSAMALIFQSFDVIKFYFQAKVQSKYVVYATNGAFLITSLVKIGLLLFGAPLIAFAMASFGEIVLSAIFLVAVFFLNHQKISTWTYKTPVVLELFKYSWPLILSGIAIIIYMRIDQVMIGQILGDKEVGIFSAAVRISEIWYFVPIAIVGSVFPTIIENKERNEILYFERMQKLLNFLSLLGICIAIIVTFMSGSIIRLFFGSSYELAGPVLAIHVWAGVFVALGVASGSWLTAENLQKYSLYRAFYGCIMNVLLNLILIPKYGINGAAIATVLSYGVSVFSIGFYDNGKIIFYMMVKSLNILNFTKKFNGRFQ